MLGQLISKASWRWNATGKHPVAMDYFQFGRNETLTESFKNWIENGYQKLLSDNKKPTSFHSWRFWAPGKQKGTIVCGISRDSSDRMGRPYPFLIIGTGTLPGWENHWEILPVIFEEIWSGMEYLASSRLNNLKELENKINEIKRPSMNEASLSNTGSASDISDMADVVKKGAGALLRDYEFYISINDNYNHDAFSLVTKWHYGLKLHLKTYPVIVLMGGSPEKSYLAAFNRSLNTDDFVKLWTI